jgi:hypothetical protein
MEHYTPRIPRQNIFNIFEKGKDFFYLRTAITLIGIGLMMIGCFKLGTRAWSVYPVVIRDAYGNVNMGVGSKYVPNDVELLRLSVTLLEALFTKTEQGLALEPLRPYIVSEKLLKDLNLQAPRAGYIQTANVFDFFFGDENKSAGLKVINAQIDLVSSDFTNVLADSVYVSALLKREAPTVENPSGWKIMAMNNLSKAQYFEARRKNVKDVLNDEPKMSELITPDEFLK